MKILISNDGKHAHFFERMGLLKAFNSMPGITCKMYEIKKYSPFDIFDSFEPDVFISQLYNLDNAHIKCIKERPHLKVALRAGDWGPVCTEPGYFDYNILYSKREEIDKIKRLKDETGQPEFVFTHYHQDDMELTHGYFKTIGIKAVGIMLGADTFEYSAPKFNDFYKCDIGFVGGYWPYKGVNLNKTLNRLCYETGLNIKIFSRGKWPVHNWCGDIEENSVKDLFFSSKICLNVHEPHSTRFGIDMNERSFKCACAGGFILSDNKWPQEKVFGKNSIVYYDNYKDLLEKVNYYTNDKNQSERNEIAQNGQLDILNGHTYFHRAEQFIRELNAV